MPCPRRLLPVLLALSLFVGSTRAQEQPPAALVREEWVLITAQGHKVGWVHTETRTGDGKNGVAFITVTESESVVQRENDQVRSRSRTREAETAAGMTLWVEKQETSSGLETGLKAELRGDKLIVAATTAGETRTKELADAKDLVGTYGQTLILKKHGFAPGTTHSYRSFSTDNESIETTRTVVKGKEKVDVHGGERELHLLEQETTQFPGVTIRSWVDDEGNMQKGILPFAGGIVMMLVPREVAQADAEGPGPDMMAATSAPCNIRIPHAHGITAARFAIRAKQGSLPGIDFPGTTVKVLESTPEAVTVSVESIAPTAPAAIGAAPAELAEFLGSNGYVQADDPEIVARAKEAVGAETDAWKASKALESWVHKHIKKKNYGVSFATAKEVVRSLEGDCTEHGVLLAALARAAGIPSRVVAGMVYYRNNFGGHMWTEVNVGGAWYPLDATLPSPLVDATHLPLAASSLQNENPSKAMSRLVGLLGSVYVEVQSFTLEGKEIAVGPDFRDTVQEGDRLTLPYHGFSVTKPAGTWFQMVPERPDVLALVMDKAARVQVPLLLQAIGYAYTLEDARTELAGMGKVEDEKSWEIQGRQAWSCRLTGPGGSARFAFVLDGDTAIGFVAAPETEAATKLWAAMIEGLKFEK